MELVSVGKGTAKITYPQSHSYGILYTKRLVYRLYTLLFMASCTTNPANIKPKMAVI